MSDKRVIAGWDETNLDDAIFGTIEIDHEKCRGCGWCALVCPAKAIEVADKKAVMNSSLGCMFCGDCQAICPDDSITLKNKPVYPGYFVIIERGEPKKPRKDF
ncbi:MAG: ATP-binding protein [Bacillota bacterium]